MKKILLTLFATALVGVGCMAQTSKTSMNNKKILVVFFSHAGENYAVGNIKVGNTKVVADYISEITGADQFEIVTHKYDGMAYTPLTQLAQEEQNKDERPAFEALITNAKGTKLDKTSLAEYDVVFIGGPVWWGTYPQVMFTFFDKYDLNGKTIYPFTTHEGSGLGRCVKDVKQAYPKADVQSGFSIYGHDVKEGKSKVEKWLQSINF